MINYSKKRFRVVVSVSMIITLFIVSLLYSFELLGETTISFWYLFGGFVVSSILIDPFEYFSAYKKIQATKANDYSDVDSISLKYMVKATTIIVVVATAIFCLIYYYNDKQFFGVFSVIYLMTMMMTFSYNTAFFISKIK